MGLAIQEEKAGYYGALNRYHILLPVCALAAAASAAAPRIEKTICAYWTVQHLPQQEADLKIDAFIREGNPKLDVKTEGYRAFLDRIGQIVQERGGHLVVADYNFLARAFSSKSDAPPAAPADDREEKRRKMRAALKVPDMLPALETEQYGEAAVADGVVAERVSYGTDYGLRVPAIVYRPSVKPAGRMPGLIVVNGHGGDKYSWYAFYAGILYARAGGVVLTYDPIGEGERNAQRKSGTRQHDRNVDPPEMGQRMGGLMMTDVMQGVSYLAQRADVDARRLAAMGYSMGSFVLGLACAVETRLNACVLTGGGNLDGEGGYWDSSSKTMCQAIPYQSLKFLGDRGAAIYDLHAARGHTLVLNGTADDVVAMPKAGPGFFEELRKRTIALHGSAQNVFEFEFVAGGGHRPYFVTRAAAVWLEKLLEFPNWASVARMGDTHISEWAEKNGVAMDRQYATELREGGTIALGTGLPAVAHDVLNALPAEKWEREKEKYVYETWVKNAKARVGR
jgi:dienelactone hydrolase